MQENQKTAHVISGLRYWINSVMKKYVLKTCLLITVKFQILVSAATLNAYS